MRLKKLLMGRVVTASRTLPTAYGWRGVGKLAAVYAALALPLGFAGGLLSLELASLPALSLLLRTLLVPSLLEELLFRALLLPPPNEARPKRWFAWAALALALFVAWHPLNAWFTPGARPVFFNPAFLTLTALLGATCTAVYWRTGSLWPPVLIHWLTVVAWLLLGKTLF